MDDCSSTDGAVGEEEGTGSGEERVGSSQGAVHRHVELNVRTHVAQRRRLPERQWGPAGRAMKMPVGYYYHIYVKHNNNVLRPFLHSLKENVFLMTKFRPQQILPTHHRKLQCVAKAQLVEQGAKKTKLMGSIPRKHT